MEPRKNQYFATRASKAVEFTKEFLDNLPVAKHPWDFKYDKDLPCLGVRRNKEGGPITFHMVTTHRQRNAMRELYSTPVGGYVTLGAVHLEVARDKTKTLKAQFDAAVERHKKMKEEHIFSTPTVTPEDILKQKPQVAAPSYEKLMEVLMDAYAQAATGKGHKRHAAGLNFEDQDMLAIMDRVGDGFAFGQAIKKICEGRRMGKVAARKEFLGAIVYIAGAILWEDMKNTRNAAPEQEDM